MLIKRYIALLVLLPFCLGLMAAGKVTKRVVVYPSVDQFDDSLLLSGMMTIPEGKRPKGIILIPHYTISAESEVPSAKPTYEAEYFKEDYILIMPDYIGYGLTSERIHPYLHGPLTARNCVDMYMHVRPVIDSLETGIPSDSLYIVGASQGGAAAVWTLKLIEEEYADRLHVIRCFAGSGPYDVASTYDDGIARNYTKLPLTIALLMAGTNAAYDLHLHADSFFMPAMQKAYKKLIAPKKYRILQLYFKMPHHKVSYWLKPEGMDKTHPETKRLYGGFLRSSLVHYPLEGDPHPSDSIVPSWKPRSPLYVFHSAQDDVVTFHNALHLQRCYPDLPNITFDFGNYGGHLKSIYTFYFKVKDMLLNEK